jgi:hypothetical protein
MSKRNHRNPQLERRWRDLIGRWQRSKLTVRDFCQAHDISEPSFYAWRSEIARRDLDHAKAAPATPTFVPVRVTPSAVIEVVLTTGVIVRVPAGADSAVVAQLVAALGDKPC